MFKSTVRICGHSFLPRLIDPDSVVLDLGAFDGDFAEAVIRQFTCRVISAEPVQEVVDRIQPHPLHKVLPVAVGGKNQQININVYATGSASIFGRMSQGEDSAMQAVEMVTLSEFRRRADVDRIDLLKLDIEGAEIGLFETSSDEELQSATQIAVEFHDFMYPDQAAAVTRIRDRMQDIGFWVLPFSLDNTDILFLNRRSGVSAAEVAYLRSVVRYGKGIARRLGRLSS